MTDLTDVYNSEQLDHDGHAACILAKYPDIYKYTPQTGWLIYRNGYWQTKGAESSVGRAIKNTLRERDKLIKKDASLENEKMRSAMRRLCKVNSGAVAGVKTVLKDYEEVEDDIDEYDQYPYLLNCSNGIVDLRTSELLDHSPNYKFTYKLSTNYNPDALDPIWFEFLDSLELSSDVLRFINLMFGYALTGSTKDELMFYFWGPTRSGKGTITNTILEVMEDLAMGTNFRTFTAKRYGDTQNFDLAPMKSKRLITASESNRDEQINSSMFKQATGGDPVWASFKGKDGFTFKPQWKILLSSNFTLNADPFDTAIWARVRTIRMTKSFVGQEDKTLKDRLTSQSCKETILNWMIGGAKDWYENGLTLPQEIVDATTYQRLQASSVLLFVDRCCSLTVDERAEGSALYGAYVDWCRSSGYRPFGRKRFTQGLDDIGVVTSVQRSSDGTRTNRYYSGIEFVGEELGTGDITKKLFGDDYKEY
jgi:putative DNA primase/helicase